MVPMSSLEPSAFADLPIFAGLAPADLASLLGEARIARFAKNAVVFEEGAEATSFYVLSEGYLRVAKLTSDGDQVIIRHIGVGEICGIAAAIGRTTYPATAVAIVESVALAWPSVAWPRLAARFPILTKNTLQKIGERLQDAHTLVIEMSTQEVERRVAHVLLRMIERAGRATGDGTLIDFPVSRQDIAEMTGTTLHTVSRTLSAWETAGFVASGRQRVVVRDAPGLRAIADAARG